MQNDVPQVFTQNKDLSNEKICSPKFFTEKKRHSSQNIESEEQSSQKQCLNNQKQCLDCQSTQILYSKATQTSEAEATSLYLQLWEIEPLETQLSEQEEQFGVLEIFRLIEHIQMIAFQIFERVNNFIGSFFQ
jgi:hypothetical protein